jgi:zinc protease
VTVDIPFEKRTLDNGLRVVAHRDAKAPIVTVSVWYHVGSKNERRGRTGLAHLFEHLMFEGSAHHDFDHFQPLENAGASLINGTTNRDRTNFFETLPSASLDLALWLESDRMGHLLGAMTQAKLDEQREVVRNEKKQSENQPYGRVGELLSRSLYPDGHPYSWPIIGRMEDLDAAGLDDVRDWFRRWYAPSNAVVVISGDVDPERAIERVEAHFGALEASTVLERPGRWIAALGEPRRVDLDDRVPQARVYRAWNVPPTYDDDYRALGLVARVLSHGKSSRLYRRLVYDDQIATDASAYLWSGEIGSSFLIQATCAPGVEARLVERALDEELEALRRDGPDTSELDRAKARARSSFLHGIERAGGFGGKSEILAHGEVFRGDPGAWAESLAAIEAARPEALRQATSTWLGAAALTLTVRPRTERGRATLDVGRDALPAVPAIVAADLAFPESTRLGNGLELIVWPRRGLPLAYARLIVDAGFAADHDAPRGTATLTMAAIDEGTARRSALEISDRLALLGARLACAAGLDDCRLGISSLAETAGPAAELLAEVALAPAFPEHEVERLKREQIARIRREMVTPVQLALRVLPLVLYGPQHPYGMPFTGSGSEEEVAATDRRHLETFHRRWIRPHRSTLVCLGDLDPERTRDAMRALFEGWETGADSGSTEPGEPAEPAPAAGARRILLLDRPESSQSVLFGGQLVPPRRHDSELDLEAFHQALGGFFTSRLNLNLREDKGWTYGAHSLLWSARRERPFLVYSSVQADATARALAEMDREVREMLADRPITEDELDRVRRQLVLSLPARRETLVDIADDIEEILVNRLRRDYYVGYARRVGTLTSGGVTETARAWLDPDRFVWVVVGDLDRTRKELEDLGWGDPTEIDGGGRPV